MFFISIIVKNRYRVGLLDCVIIDLSGAKEILAGHPVDVFKQKNNALKQRIAYIENLLIGFPTLSEEEFEGYLYRLPALLNELQDVDKHYLRKEYLLFPFLEKAGITGHLKVMWGKQDKTRALLKAVYASLSSQSLPTRDAFAQIVGLVIVPALEAIQNMILKEEEILLPMSMDTLDGTACGRYTRRSLCQFRFVYNPVPAG